MVEPGIPGANDDRENRSPPGPRVLEHRGQRRFDAVPFVVSDDYKAAVLVARADAAWGKPLDVRGVEWVDLLVDFTQGSVTSLGIAVQACFEESGSDSDWYDRRTDGDVATGKSTTIPAGTDHDLTFAGSGNFVVRVQAVGSYMRFKPYVDAGAGTGSACRLRALRHQEG